MASSRFSKLNQCSARPGEKLVLALAHLDSQRPPEHQAAQHRHGKRFTLRQDSIQVLEMDRDELCVGTKSRKVVETALEHGNRPVHTARSFRKDDQRMS